MQADVGERRPHGRTAAAFAQMGTTLASVSGALAFFGDGTGSSNRDSASGVGFGSRRIRRVRRRGPRRRAARGSLQSGEIRRAGVVFIGHVYWTCSSDVFIRYKNGVSVRGLQPWSASLRDLVPVRTVRNFPAGHLGYLRNECDEWARDVSVYGKSSRLGRGFWERSRRLPDLAPHFIPPGPGFRREGNYRRCRICVCQPLQCIAQLVIRESVAFGCDEHEIASRRIKEIQ